MNLPTYIKGNYKKSGKFDNGSRLVLGTSGIGGIWGKVHEIESIDTLLYALENGVKVLDTSPSYNKAQKYLGKALNEWEGDRPFISTKVGRLQTQNADDVDLDYTPDGLKRSIEKSLNIMGIDFIDLLFLHEPHLVPIDFIDDILSTLHQFKEQGIVGQLGVGGNPRDEFWPYVTKENFDVASSFLKLDACCLDGLENDVPRFQKEGIAIYAASSLHMGLLGRQFQEYVKFTPKSKWIKDSHIENAILVKDIAKKYKLSLPNLALRYLFSMEEADRVVLGPINRKELKKSLSAWEQGKLPKYIFEEISECIAVPVK